MPALHWGGEHGVFVGSAHAASALSHLKAAAGGRRATPRAAAVCMHAWLLGPGRAAGLLGRLMDAVQSCWQHVGRGRACSWLAGRNGALTGLTYTSGAVENASRRLGRASGAEEVADPRLRCCQALLTIQ